MVSRYHQHNVLFSASSATYCSLSRWKIFPKSVADSPTLVADLPKIGGGIRKIGGRFSLTSLMDFPVCPSMFAWNLEVRIESVPVVFLLRTGISNAHKS